jgi:N-acetylglucosaminyldiphosphoundecaprenol N-acetyl-beta-D-mannosaminyltransferase
MKIDIAGVLVDDVTNQEALNKIKEFVISGTSHYIVTPYSEFIVTASNNSQFKEAVNKADLSLPDGVGILWAGKFLSMPKKNPVVTFLNWFGSLASIVLSPNSVRTVFKEQVSGSRIIWDIAKLAEDNKFSLSLVGGFNGVAEKTAQALKNRYPNLTINLAYSPAGDFDEEVIRKINDSNSDILLIAYQPPKQEIWMAENKDRLNVKVVMGLGGTFDYISGLYQQAPDFMYNLGLEWLWRMITQPKRIKRIWNATVIFSLLTLRYKLR